ncbi:MAG: hypothetical protein HKN12_05705 [Gemmatimonadetes bacterium]|nr:hypothetical protein [Gemmatimonadota bacterium]
MSGTDVADQEGTEGTTEDQDAPKKGNLLGLLKVWLPFPVILGAVFFWQFKSGGFSPPEPEATADQTVFEGAGPELPVLLEALQQERASLQRAWEQLRFAERRVLIEQSEIEARQTDIEALLARVEANVQVMEDERTQMLSQVARVYETMKPDAAAQILSGIDVDTSTEIIRRMKERNAAAVMASLEPQAAARISQKMIRTP